MPNMSLKKNPMPEQDAVVRAGNFKEVALGYTREIAMEEADRCLNCKNAPCVTGCPVNVPIPISLRRSRKATSRARMRSSAPRTACLPSAAASAPRRPNARASACEASRVKRWALAAWNALPPTMP